MSFTGLIAATAGKGKGSEVVDADFDKDSNFIDEMYSKRDENIDIRAKNAPKFVNSFYNIVTDFYEQGWGPSFHFAPRAVNETFTDSILRLEHYMALRLNIQPGDKVLDLGCGIGGPMRNIALFTGANIVGVTINDYQVRRGSELNKQYKLDGQCKLIKDNFLELKSFEDNTFDKIFALEATCHAPNRNKVFEQVYRVLKPGGLFVSTEWVLKSDKFDKNDKKHQLIKYQIEKGNALPDLVTEKSMLSSLDQCGLNVLDSFDLDLKSRKLGQIPWYKTLEFDYTMQTAQHSTPATYVVSWLTYAMEGLGIAPKGTYNAHQIIIVARDGLVEGGKTQVFTPYYFVLAQKPKGNDEDQKL